MVFLVTDYEACEKMNPCQLGGRCSHVSAYPYYTCKFPVWCFGNSCQSWYPIPALVASPMTIIVGNGEAIEAPSTDGWIESVVLNIGNNEHLILIYYGYY